MTVRDAGTTISTTMAFQVRRSSAVLFVYFVYFVVLAYFVLFVYLVYFVVLVSFAVRRGAASGGFFRRGERSQKHERVDARVVSVAECDVVRVIAYRPHTRNRQRTRFFGGEDGE